MSVSNSAKDVLLIKIDKNYDENWGEEEYNKLRQTYVDKIAERDENNSIYKDSGFDLFVPYVKKEVTIEARSNKVVNLRVAAALYRSGIPSPYYVYARSSIYKTPFILANGVGIIDNGYRGNLGIALHNHSMTPQEVKCGTRMVQICLPDLDPNFDIKLVNELDDTARGSGGFGSTGQ